MFLSFIEDFKNINNIIQNNFNEKEVLNSLLLKLKEIVDANIILVDKDGYLLQEILMTNFSLTYKNNFTNQVKIEEQVLYQLNNLNEIKMNVTLDNLCISLATKDELREYYAIFYPLIINNNRVATLIVYSKKRFDNEIELALHHIVPMLSIILHYINFKKIDDDKKNKNIVKAAISTLSYSELDAIIHIFNEMNEDEGVIIASKIADKFGITRSVIVNALRKFESAGIFETRSLGMKGTYIKVVNDKFICEINKLKK